MDENPIQDFITSDLGPGYINDEWICLFIIECLKLFGAPVSLPDCLSFEEEIYHTFSAAALILAMKEFKREWEEMRTLDPIDAAFQFAKIYKEERDDDLIPPFTSNSNYIQE
tara:strand:+ start:646 stop:981 length:336 start_codon:yes stop_codon:yes gene_type:complete